MIYFNNQTFHLSTDATSYIIGVRDDRYLENLYYGKKVRVSDDYQALSKKYATGYGDSIVSPYENELTLDDLTMEYSCGGIGDYRNLPLEICMPDHSYSNRFYYQSHDIYDGVYKESGQTKMPYARYGEDAKTLEILLVDELFSVELKLIYTVFEACDVITRRTVVKNNCKNPITIQKIMSMQLDLPEKDYILETFDGTWTRERHRNKKQLVSGIYVNESTTGSSSNRHNPFIIVAKEHCTEKTGNCFGINLIYSGNHYEAVEVTPFDHIRIMSGINPYRFSWELSQGQTFYSPEAVLSFSAHGRQGLSKQLGDFVNKHIITKQWQYKERPILINNWEATYFDFTEKKLLKIAKEAADLGIELFVLDDGWFGKRDSDTCSLGDWFVNEKKIGGSIKELASKINGLGMQFGLWFEPEMISEDSELYRNHENWAVKIPNRDSYLGRNQYVLDLTREDVRDAVTKMVSDVLDSANITYVKWDMNRFISDCYSASLGTRQDEFFHRYMLGLYEILNQIVTSHEQILFESCSSGGNRFDLGMLFYMPQTWTSDDTDANERISIQEGTSYAYPLSTMGAHMSAVPNHQTLRNINLETRFHVACFGDLGYELDVTKLTKAEKKIIKEQITFYKKYRMLFQFGDFSRFRMHNGNIVWQVVSKDKEQAIVMCYQQLQTPNKSNDILRVTGLEPDMLYTVVTRKQAISIKQFGDLVNQVSKIPIKDEGVVQAVINKVFTLYSEEETYKIYGDMFENAGIKLKEQFIGTGYNENTRVMGDFATRLYVIQKA